MKFSIVIPAFNEEGGIAKTLDALLRQTYTDYEIIVVDNNSTDNTSTIVNDYRMRYPQKIHLVRCDVQGLPHARNTGLYAAQGDIIAQCDADTIVATDWLMNAFRNFVKKPDTVAFAGAYDYADACELLGPKGIILQYGGLASQYLFFSVGNWYLRKTGKGALMVGGNAFIKKSALLATGGYDLTRTFYSEDLVTACQIATVGPVRFCSGITAKTSARRHKEQGWLALQKKYNAGTRAVLRRRPIPQQAEELEHPR